tara:strand:- start:1915 stop:3648 length:1734 start_codon:yes stop_codon:yes gene_type:complete
MAGAQIEVKYFNTFLLKKVSTTGNVAQGKIIYNGSFGVPGEALLGGIQGGYPVLLSQNNVNSWVIEESRIRGGYNNTSVDFGAKAYLIENEPSGVRRFNTLIYSGIFNSKTGINKTNVFSVGTDITKSADPANGSIQKLYAEDTNLNVFQELKVSRALIDKDAIYSAEGGGTVTASNLVIGVIQPILGKYGISQNPESFAIYGNRKYFSDKNNNAILRLSGGSIEEISSLGMKDFFRDNINRVNTAQGLGKILGAYDIYTSEYVSSLQFNRPIPSSEADSFATLSFDERAKGWTSFFSYKPDQIFSLRNNFYSVKTSDLGVSELWRHNSTQVNRGSFYGENHRTSITFVLNPMPTNSKTFKTIGYQGSNGWEVNSMVSDSTGTVYNNNNSFSVLSLDSISQIKSYTEGEYVVTEGSGNSLSASSLTTVSLDINSVNGIIRVGDSVSGVGVTGGTIVVSYDAGNGDLVVNLLFNNLLANTLLSFTGAVTRVEYNTVFGNNIPGLPRYYAGFNLKENKYVSNVTNNSLASNGEVVFGDSVGGIKGYYSTVTMSTELTTDLGGEKTLFSVESFYDVNNGY